MLSPKADLESRIRALVSVRSGMKSSSLVAVSNAAVMRERFSSSSWLRGLLVINVCQMLVSCMVSGAWREIEHKYFKTYSILSLDQLRT